MHSVGLQRLVADGKACSKLINELDPALPFLMHINLGSTRITVDFVDGNGVDRALSVEPEHISTAKLILQDGGWRFV